MESTFSFKKVLPFTCTLSYFKFSNSYLQKSVAEKKSSDSISVAEKKSSDSIDY